MTRNTETRRPTGSSPNLLQLGKKGDGIQVRKCFLPNKKLGHDLICSLDWDGEELRIIADLSGDKELSSCYVGNDLKDVHSIVAAQIKGCSYEEFVSVRKGTQGAEKAKEYDNIRKSAKSVVFGGNYGIGAAKISSPTSYPC
ncbi:MAG: DNA polymerase [Methylococcaceae bacterium]